MREIKFRAYNKEDKIMREPLYFNELLCSDRELQSKCGEYSLPRKDYIFNNPDDIWMQYTGLKDKNGKEVYEGDILRMDTKNDKDNKLDISMDKRGVTFYYCEVLYHDNFLFNNVKVFDRGEEVDSTWGDQTFLRYLCTRGYIIGNIYENPDLLTNK